MRFIGDLHVHSRYSMATSKEMTPEGIWKWCQLKGIKVAGTGDFTHPGWFKELNEKLLPAGNGLFQLKTQYRGVGEVPQSCASEVFFLLSAEISCIYRKNGRTRKVHCLIFVPDLGKAARIGRALSRIGNIAADGRPILGLDAKELLRITIDAAPDALFVPAHAWTPHFSVFGGAGGFDSLEECFEELAPLVRAIETGLSSDPPMNRRLSQLDRLNLISNSDAHSPLKLGREANIFDTDVSYQAMVDAIRDRKGFAGTLEFFPEEGKYHYDGHRSCGSSCHPVEAMRRNDLCPVCGKRFTMGVLHRIEMLADREAGYSAEAAIPHRSVIPLFELIAEVKGIGPASKGVQKGYLDLLAGLGSELTILLEASIDDIREACNPMIAQAVQRMRAGLVSIEPGYDGQYGRIRMRPGRDTAG